MENIQDIAILYSHTYDTPTSTCVTILTLQNGMHKFYTLEHLISHAHGRANEYSSCRALNNINQPCHLYCSTMYSSNSDVHGEQFLKFEISPSLAEMCKEYDLKKQPLFFKVTLSEEKNTIDKVIDLKQTYTNYILDQIPLETVCHLLQMKHDMEMSRMKQDIKESLLRFKTQYENDMCRMVTNIADTISDIYVNAKLL